MKTTIITPKQIMMEIFPVLGEFKMMKKKAKATYASVRTYDKLESIMKSYDKARLQLLEDHCVKDKDGKPVLIEDPKNKMSKNYDFENDEKRAFIEKEISTIADTEHEVEIYSMEFSEIEDLELADHVLEVLLRFNIVLAPDERINVLKPV